MEVIRGKEFRVIAVDLEKLLREPIAHGLFLENLGSFQI